MRNSIQSIALTALLIGSAAGLQAGAAELRIGTASLGGAFYPVGQGISNLVNEHSGGLAMVPVVTQGSVQNPRLVGSGEVEFAITNNNLARLAVLGKGPYKSGKIDIKAVAPLHPSVLHMATLADSPIERFTDLEGKRVAVGPAGGGTLAFLRILLALHDMSIDDIQPSFLSYSDGFTQLGDGNVDAAFALSGYPAAAVMQTVATKRLKFLQIDDDRYAAFLTKYDAYRAVTIPKEVYKLTEDARVLGVNNMLITLSSTDQDTVYRVVKAVYDNLDEFKAENANAKQIVPGDYEAFKIELHPGAARYFE